MKQITIYDLLPLLNDGYVAMDENGNWWWYKLKPRAYKRCKGWKAVTGQNMKLNTMEMKDIAPFDGDWKDSLIKVEHKCSSSGQVKEPSINIEDFASPHPTGFMSESQLKRMFEHKEEE